MGKWPDGYGSSVYAGKEWKRKHITEVVFVSSRREHRAIFEAAAQRFRAAPFAAPDTGRLGEADSGRGVRVCVRKRPIFSHEIEQGEFDAITCLDGRLVVHDARMHPDMVKLFMNHHDFAFDDTFGESANNAEVYEGTARQLVLDALEGKQGTVMMYGQTGSGKTYTMRSIYEQAADDIFSGVDGRTVTVSFIELFGENCFDMLNQGAPCQLTTAQDGSVHPFPCVEVEVSNPMELLALIELAGKLRATAATGVHDQSSRSHALCRIFVESGDVEGCVTLVDLAGSEHRIDNAEHNAERRKEGAKINASLAALKECIRARASHSKFIAFRQNRLTQLLRGCFLPGRSGMTGKLGDSGWIVEHRILTAVELQASRGNRRRNSLAALPSREGFLCSQYSLTFANDVAPQIKSFELEEVKHGICTLNST
eukprot:s3_g54.t1